MEESNNERVMSSPIEKAEQRDRKQQMHLRLNERTGEGTSTQIDNDQKTGEAVKAGVEGKLQLHRLFKP